MFLIITNPAFVKPLGKVKNIGEITADQVHLTRKSFGFRIFFL